MDSIVAAALTAGLLAVDHRSSLQLMISQPLCGGLVTGLVLGAPAEGLLAGGLFQMMFLGYVPVRGGLAPDLPIGGVAAAALFILSGRSTGGDPLLGGMLLACSLAPALLTAAAGGLFHRWWERWTAVFADAALRYAREGKLRRISALHLASLLVHFGFAFVAIVVIVAAGRPVVSFSVVKLAGRFGETLPSFAVLVPFIGVGTLLRMHAVRTRMFLFGAGFLVSYVALLIRG